MTAKAMSNSQPQRKVGAREKSAEATRDSLLKAAIKVFAKHGFDGGSIDQISKAANSHDRMIYYYFGNKESLFVAALEEIYRRFNVAEAALKLDLEQPKLALEQVVRFVLHYYKIHPEFVTLLKSENLHRGKHIARSNKAREFSSPAISVVDEVLRQGIAQGIFRATVASRDLYMMIVALGYFYQSNRFTLSAFLGEDLETPAVFEQWETFVIDAVLRTVLTPAAL
jgi:AcrR family transcriptional regulator